MYYIYIYIVNIFPISYVWIARVFVFFLFMILRYKHRICVFPYQKLNEQSFSLPESEKTTRLFKPWWRHQMETLSALPVLCAGNSPVPVNSPHKGQWRGALMFSLTCDWINDWINNREADDLIRYRGHYDVIVMIKPYSSWYVYEVGINIKGMTFQLYVSLGCINSRFRKLQIGMRASLSLPCDIS